MAAETKALKPRPPTNPHPLRVANFESTLARTNGTASPRSASPARTARSTANKKETTVVGVGTHGLGHRAQELHDYFQRLVYKEWCDRKRLERAKARAENDVPASPTPPSGKDRVAARKYQETLRAMEAENRLKGLTEEFGKLKQTLKEEHKRAQAEDTAFRFQFAADNVVEARHHLHSAREHRQQLENFSLPELAPLRQEFQEEQERWDQLRREQKEAESEEKRARRQYVLDLKKIAHHGFADENSARSTEAAKQRQSLQMKERRRKKEREELILGLSEAVRERRNQRRLATARARQEQRERVEKYVEQRQKEFSAIDQPIEQAREEWLQRMKQVLKQRHDDEKEESHLSGRAAFLTQRKALANDLRVETARLQGEVAKEREERRQEKKALHDEERRAVTARREKRGGWSPQKPSWAPSEASAMRIASVTFA